MIEQLKLVKNSSLPNLEALRKEAEEDPDIEMKRQLIRERQV
jgi:hypothetical protein